MRAVERGSLGEDRAVGGGCRAHDHLRALTTRGEARGLDALAPFRFRLVDPVLDHGHRRADAADVLLRGQLLQVDLGGQLHVDADAVRPAAGLGDEFGGGFRDGLEVDVAAKVVLDPQRARDLDHLLHRVVGVADDPGAKEQALDVVAPVEVERELDHLLGREARAAHVAALAVDAVQAVVDAEVGQQDLEQRHAAAIGRVAVADARARGGTQPFAVARVALGRAAARARGVVLGGVGEDGKLGGKVHKIGFKLPRVVYAGPSIFGRQAGGAPASSCTETRRRCAAGGDGQPAATLPLSAMPG